jgi:hypothetical protein
MQVDKVLFPVHMFKAGAPPISIHLEQVDTTQGKNVIIGELRVAPNVKKIRAQGGA